MHYLALIVLYATASVLLDVATGHHNAVQAARTGGQASAVALGTGLMFYLPLGCAIALATEYIAPGCGNWVAAGVGGALIVIACGYLLYYRGLLRKHHL